jgi:hypothetical protein
VQTYLRISSVLFGLVAVGHLLRLFRHWSFEIAGRSVPTGASLVALVIAGCLCVWGLRLSSQGVPPAS